MAPMELCRKEGEGSPAGVKDGAEDGGGGGPAGVVVGWSPPKENKEAAAARCCFLCGVAGELESGILNMLASGMLSGFEIAR